MVKPTKASPVTGTTLMTTGPVPATLGSERHRYAIIAWPDKLGTDPMAVGGY